MRPILRHEHLFHPCLAVPRELRPLIRKDTQLDKINLEGFNNNQREIVQCYLQICFIYSVCRFSQLRQLFRPFLMTTLKFSSRGWTTPIGFHITIHGIEDFATLWFPVYTVFRKCTQSNPAQRVELDVTWMQWCRYDRCIPSDAILLLVRFNPENNLDSRTRKYLSYFLGTYVGWSKEKG